MIKYRKGYKYQLAEDYSIDLPEFALAGSVIDDHFVTISPVGRISFKAGYAWDGPSGPTIDTRSFMRASLVHDGLYQLIREGHIDRSRWRDADLVLHRLAREDGMSRLRAWWVLKGLALAHGAAADPRQIKKVIVA